MRNSALTLYKEGGVSHDTPGVSGTTPQEMAERIAGKQGASLFGRNSLVSVVDNRLPDKGFRILALLSAVCWDAPVQLAFEEIAFAVDSSRPQVIRHLKVLESNGYITVRRSRNRRNEYSVIGVTGESIVRRRPVDQPGEKASNTAGKDAEPQRFQQCTRCRRPGKTTKGAMCRTCYGQVDLAALVESARAELGQDATPEQLAAHLKNARLAQRIRRILEKSERAA